MPEAAERLDARLGGVRCPPYRTLTTTIATSAAATAGQPIHRYPNITIRMAAMPRSEVLHSSGRRSLTLMTASRLWLEPLAALPGADKASARGLVDAGSGLGRGTGCSTWVPAICAAY
jgi:hypothetical protein